MQAEFVEVLNFSLEPPHLSLTLYTGPLSILAKQTQESGYLPPVSRDSAAKKSCWSRLTDLSRIPLVNGTSPPLVHEPDPILLLFPVPPDPSLALVPEPDPTAPLVPQPDPTLPPVPVPLTPSSL